MSEMDLDITLCFESSLYTQSVMKAVQSLLSDHIPDWSEDLRLHRDGLANRPISVGKTDSLFQALKTVVADRGPTFHALVDKFGGDTREFGSAEFRGADDTLILIVSFDQQGFAPSAGRWLWANTITFQLRNFILQSSSGPIESFRRLFEDSVSKLAPTYATACCHSEFEGKNLNCDNGVMAIGVDISRYLPGLYWGNYYGLIYSDLMRLNERADSLREICELDRRESGTFLFLSNSPFEHSLKEYHSRESEVRSRIGNRYFFSRNTDNQNTEAPEFGLPRLPRVARFS